MGAPPQVDNNEWFVEWMTMAYQAKLVVCFQDAGYLASEACMKEYNYASTECRAMLVVDDYETASIADTTARIMSKLRHGR